ncbi:hypothetical protein BDY19DRAFT_705761 [Irpex rosettiformis]|uniref:Uncharacterized protein n=1 Tax=Irpex rosettiformis TaxID=378272 RepID=A0ACB8TMX8_9APHY|nr:hypothetical protein BDY19DRAFT_705761 [Irpex rosettiformis]
MENGILCGCLICAVKRQLSRASTRSRGVHHERPRGILSEYQRFPFPFSSSTRHSHARCVVMNEIDVRSMIAPPDRSPHRSRLDAPTFNTRSYPIPWSLVTIPFNRKCPDRDFCGRAGNTTPNIEGCGATSKTTGCQYFPIHPPHYPVHYDPGLLFIQVQYSC